MAKLFNRKSADVIQYGLDHTLEEFIKEYSNTTATVDSLTKAYNEINGNKTKSKIAVKSGDAKPDEPIKPVHYTQNEEGILEKIDTTDIPKRENDPDHVPSGKPIVATYTAGGPDDPAVIAKKKPGAKAGKAAPKAAPAKGTGTFSKPAATKDGAKVTGSKRDAIRALLEETPDLSGKEIKAAIMAQGYASIYDSEIGAVKKSIAADAEKEK